MHKSLFLLIAAAALAAAPASGQKPKLGQRTAAPEQSMAGIGGGSSDVEVAQELAAAANYPVGTLQNPVRVVGPDGERAYLARLRCGDGSLPRIGAQRPGGSDAFGNVADLAPADCGGATPAHADIHIDIYQEEHVLEAAPAGFQLAPH
jgi:hypothetical protein